MNNNILVIDSNDSEISYRHTSVDNYADIPLSVDEIFEIADKNRSDIFKINTSNLLMLVLDDNSEIPLHKYKPGNKVIFIKLISGKLKDIDSEILLAVNNSHYISPEPLPWLIKENNLYKPLKSKPAVNFIDGYTLCDDFLKAAGNNPEIIMLPAIEYCNYQKIQIGQTVYQGFLPSMTQILVIDMLFEKYDLLNWIFKHINAEFIDLFKDEWWTSNYVMGNAYLLTKGKIQPLYASEKRNILPIFKKL